MNKNIKFLAIVILVIGVSCFAVACSHSNSSDVDKSNVTQSALVSGDQSVQSSENGTGTTASDAEGETSSVKAGTTALANSKSSGDSKSSSSSSADNGNAPGDNDVAFESPEGSQSGSSTTKSSSATTNNTSTTKAKQSATDKDGWVTKWY